MVLAETMIKSDKYTKPYKLNQLNRDNAQIRQLT